MSRLVSTVLLASSQYVCPWAEHQWLLVEDNAKPLRVGYHRGMYYRKSCRKSPTLYIFYELHSLPTTQILWKVIQVKICMLNSRVFDANKAKAVAIVPQLEANSRGDHVGDIELAVMGEPVLMEVPREHPLRFIPLHYLQDLHTQRNLLNFQSRVTFSTALTYLYSSLQWQMEIGVWNCDDLAKCICKR